MTDEAQVLRAVVEDMRELIRECHEAAQELRHERQQAHKVMAEMKATSQRTVAQVGQEYQKLQRTLNDETDKLLADYTKGLKQDLESMTDKAYQTFVQVVYDRLVEDANLQALARKLAYERENLMLDAQREEAEINRIRKERGLPEGRVIFGKEDRRGKQD